MHRCGTVLLYTCTTDFFNLSETLFIVGLTKLGGSGGMLPQENFEIMNAKSSILSISEK